MGSWFENAVGAAADTGAKLYAQKAKDAREQLLYQTRLDEQRLYQENKTKEDRAYDADLVDTRAMEAEIIQEKKDDERDTKRIRDEYNAKETAKATRALNKLDKIEAEGRVAATKQANVDAHFGYSTQGALDSEIDSVTKTVVGTKPVGDSAFEPATPESTEKYLKEKTRFRAALSKSVKVAYEASLPDENQNRKWSHKSVAEIGQMLVETKSRVQEYAKDGVDGYMSPIDAMKKGYTEHQFEQRDGMFRHMLKTMGPRSTWTPQLRKIAQGRISAWEKAKGIKFDMKL